ncbi:uridine kinase [Candidatus Sumerlaeota bacterium]|nr:uridine kinase [Candidatus Sumerlaeota bacterium]
MSEKPIVVAIAGGTCSGKTEVAREIAGRFAARKPLILSMDGYYQDLSSLSPEKRELCNFDVPEAIDSVLLRKHIFALSQGEPIEKPAYSFAEHVRRPETERIVPEPNTLVLFEGLFALYWREIRELCNLRVFLEIDPGTALKRRLERDQVKRGRDAASIVKQYNESVKPMYDKHVMPTRIFADVVLDGLGSIPHLANKVIGLIAELPTHPS